MAQKDQLTKGTQVEVRAFTATVADKPDTYTDFVQLRDADGRISYVDYRQLQVSLPYEDGKLYMSARGSFYTYKAGADKFIPGTWTEMGGSEQPFNFPTRPLRPAVISDQLIAL